MRKLLLCLLLAALLVGCRQSDVPPPTTTAAPETTSAPVTTAAPETTVAPVTTAAPETTSASVTTAPPATTPAPVSPHYAAVEAAWDALALSTHPSFYDGWQIDLVCALLEGDTAGMEKALSVKPGLFSDLADLTVTDWSLRTDTRTIQTEPIVITDTFPVLDLTVASGGNESLGPGTHSFAIVEGLMRYLRPVETYRILSPTHTPAQDYVIARIHESSQFGIGDFIVDRLNSITGNTDYNPYPREEIIAYAADHLGLTEADIMWEALDAVDGGYTRIGRGRGTPPYSFVSEVERDGETIVTVQFWAEFSCLIKSQTIEYHLRPGTRDFILTEKIITADTGHGTPHVST